MIEAVIGTDLALLKAVVVAPEATRPLLMTTTTTAAVLLEATALVVTTIAAAPHPASSMIDVREEQVTVVPHLVVAWAEMSTARHARAILRSLTMPGLDYPLVATMIHTPTVTAADPTTEDAHLPLVALDPAALEVAQHMRPPQPTTHLVVAISNTTDPPAANSML